MGASCKVIQAPALEKKGDLAAILTNLEEGEFLFIDEIHRLSAPIEEMLYAAMEDRKLDILIGQGPSAQTLKVDLRPFTLVGATTRAGLISKPLHDRFGMVHRLEYYTRADLAIIARRSADVLGMEMVPEGAEAIARRSRGTPRICNRLLRRCRDYAEVKGEGIITWNPPRPACASTKWTTWAWMAWTGTTSRPSATSTGAGPWGCGPWPRPWARTKARWRIWWSPTSCRWDSWIARPRAGRPRMPPMPTWGCSRTRAAVPVGACSAPVYRTAPRAVLPRARPGGPALADTGPSTRGGRPPDAAYAYLGVKSDPGPLFR